MLDMLYNFAERQPLLTETEELALARAWKDSGDICARNKLIEAHMRLAITAARKFTRLGLSQDDLVQVANWSLFFAANKFDTELGIRFSTYASYWMKSMLLRYIEENRYSVKSGVSPRHKKLFSHLPKQLEKLRREAVRQGRAPTQGELLEQVANWFGEPIELVEQVHGRLQASDVSLSAPRTFGEEAGESLLDTLVCSEPGPEAVVMQRSDRAKTMRVIESALDQLSERERTIIWRRYLSKEEATLQVLADQFAISRERVRQIEEKTLAYLQRRLRSELRVTALDLVD